MQIQDILFLLSFSLNLESLFIINKDKKIIDNRDEVIKDIIKDLAIILSIIYDPELSESEKIEKVKSVTKFINM